MDISKLKISYATNDHIDALKYIWHECFGDEYEYINFFFKNRFKGIKTVIALYEEKVVGAAYLMPVKAMEYGEIKNGWYGYAIGILKEFRKNGIYAIMHQKIMEEISARNEFYILCPANEKLCEYYATLGFKEFSYLKTMKFDYCDTQCKISSDAISSKRYTELRNEFFNHDGFIFWDENAIDYAIKENEFCGGFADEIKIDKKAFAVLSRPFEKGIKIIESTVTDEYIKDITSHLLKKYGFEYALWTMPAYDDESEKYLSAMSCNLKKGDFPYLNIVLN